MKPSESTNNSLSGLRDGLNATIQESLNALDALVQEVSAADLFIAVAANIMSMAAVPGATALDPTLPQLETLAYYLYPYFDTLSEQAITVEQSQHCLSILDKLYLGLPRNTVQGVKQVGRVE